VGFDLALAVDLCKYSVDEV